MLFKVGEINKILFTFGGNIIRVEKAFLNDLVTDPIFVVVGYSHAEVVRESEKVKKGDYYHEGKEKII